MRNHVIVTLFLLVGFPGFSFAGGPVHGAKAAGMNTAFVAVADDPSAILHNPAGLTQMRGTNIYGGITFLIPATTYTSPSGESEKTDYQFFYPPHLYISSDLGKENIVFGLGVYSPFGIGGRKWPEEGLTRYISVEGFMGTVTVNPTVAWQVAPNLSIAAGVDYMKVINRAENKLNQNMVGAADAGMKIEADGDGWGYNLGALITISEKIRFGLAWRSSIKVDQTGDLKVNGIAPALQPLFGSSEFKTDVSTACTFPEIYSIGIAFFPNKKLVFDFDVELVKWSSFKDTVLDLEDEVPAAGFTDMTTRLDWKDSWQYKVGMQYLLNDTLSLRSGYAFVNTNVPESTLSPANPDSDQHNFSIGAGYLTGKWTFDAFYNFGYYKARNVSNDTLSGKYENHIHYAGLSAGYNF